MKYEHYREDDNLIKVCLVVGHLRVCGWASTWKEIAPMERRLSRMIHDHERLSDTQSV